MSLIKQGLLRFNLRALALFVLFMVILAVALRPAADNDLFWHLASGKFITITGRVPMVDPFSWTALGRRWIAHEWLTEIAFYHLYLIGGYTLLSIVATAAILLAFLLTYCSSRKLGGSPLLTMLAIALAALASAPTWGVRPQMITMLFIAIGQLLLSTVWMTGRWRLLGLYPPLMLLWVNLHGGFAFGIVLLATFTVSYTVERLAQRTDRLRTLKRVVELTPESRLPLMAVWGSLVASIIATLGNPNALMGALYPISYLGNNASKRWISEWQAPLYWEPRYEPFFVLLAVFVVYVLLAPHRPRLRELFIGASFGYLALSSSRNINVFAVAITPSVALCLSSLIPRLLERRLNALQSFGQRLLRMNTFKAVVNGLVALVVIALVLALRVPAITASGTLSAQAAQFPTGATHYILDHPPQHLFNSYNWGGYLVWRLYPQTGVFVDGRADMYGDGFIDQFMSTWIGKRGWDKTLRQWGVDMILVEPTSGIGKKLSHDRTWRVVYRDTLSVVYVPAQPALKTIAAH